MHVKPQALVSQFRNKMDGVDVGDDSGCGLEIQLIMPVGEPASIIWPTNNLTCQDFNSALSSMRRRLLIIHMDICSQIRYPQYSIRMQELKYQLLMVYILPCPQD